MTKLPKDPVENTYLLLVDAGATHTRALVASTEGEIFGRGHAGAGNAFAVGEKIAQANLLRAVREALVAAQLRGSEIAATVVGSAGVESERPESARLSRVLRRHVPLARIRVVADAVIALEGALCGAPGVVIVSGTGSIVLGKTAQGERIKIGGWGPLLGDEGSAQWIARQALHAAARAADSTGPPTALVRALTRHYCLPHFRRIIYPLYQHPITPAELGALTPLVARAAKRGDAVASGIFRRAGEELATQAAQAVRRLGVKRVKVSYQGAMFGVGRILLDPVRAALKRCAPEAAFEAPVLPPIGGAFLLALDCLGMAPARQAIARFRRHCHV